MALGVLERPSKSGKKYDGGGGDGGGENFLILYKFETIQIEYQIPQTFNQFNVVRNS